MVEETEDKEKGGRNKEVGIFVPEGLGDKVLPLDREKIDMTHRKMAV